MSNFGSMSCSESRLKARPNCAGHGAAQPKSAAIARAMISPATADRRMLASLRVLRCRKAFEVPPQYKGSNAKHRPQHHVAEAEMPRQAVAQLSQAGHRQEH